MAFAGNLPILARLYDQDTDGTLRSRDIGIHG